MKEETKFTMKEVAAASGLNVNTLQSRRRRLGIKVINGGVTLAEVKQIIKRPPVKRGGFSQRKADALYRMLKNDGAL